MAWTGKRKRSGDIKLRVNKETEAESTKSKLRKQAERNEVSNRKREEWGYKCGAFLSEE